MADMSGDAVAQAARALRESAQAHKRASRLHRRAARDCMQSLRLLEEAQKKRA